MISSESFSMLSHFANLQKSQDPKNQMGSGIRNPFLTFGNVMHPPIASKLRLSVITKKSLGGMATRSTLSGGSRSGATTPSDFKMPSLLMNHNVVTTRSDLSVPDRSASLNYSADHSHNSKFRSQPLRVSRPDFSRMAENPVADQPVAHDQLLDLQSKSDSGSGDTPSPPVSTQLIPTRFSQQEMLKELLNRSITENVEFILQRPNRPKLDTTVPTAKMVGQLKENGLGSGSASSTRSILVKSSRLPRDISRLNDSCSPKKKVAFAKNKMVLLFTRGA